MTKVVTF